MLDWVGFLIVALLAIAQYGWLDEKPPPPRAKDGVYQI
jgi:hypothetical protein